MKRSFFNYAQSKNIVRLLTEGFGIGIPIPQSDEQDDDGGEQDDREGEGEQSEGQGQGEGKQGKGKPDSSKPDKGEKPGWGDPDDMLRDGKTPRPLEGSDAPNTEEDIKNEDSIKDIKRKVGANQHNGGELVAAQRRIEDLGVQQLNWEKVLKTMLMKFKSPTEFSYRQVERDTHIKGILGMGRVPGEVEEDVDRVGNVMIALDTSGSMTDNMLSQFCSVIENIAKRREVMKGLGIIRIVYYSDTAWGYQDFTPKDRSSRIKDVVMRTAGQKSGGNTWPKVMQDIFSAPNNIPNVSSGAATTTTPSVSAASTEVTPRKTARTKTVPNDLFDGYIFLTDGGEFGSFEGTYSTVPSKLSKRRPRAPFVLCLTEGATMFNLNFLEFVKQQDPACQIIDIK